MRQLVSWQESWATVGQHGARRQHGVEDIFWNLAVQIEAAVDKSLIGGLVVRTGDLVIDASVRGKLTKLAESLGS